MGFRSREPTEVEPVAVPVTRRRLTVYLFMAGRLRAGRFFQRTRSWTAGTTKRCSNHDIVTSVHRRFQSHPKLIVLPVIVLPWTSGDESLIPLPVSLGLRSFDERHGDGFQDPEFLTDSCSGQFVVPGYHYDLDIGPFTF